MSHICANSRLELVIKSEIVQRQFNKIPIDPRYHMLQHLTPKFESDPAPSQREKRAALILNRFSRTSPVLYATDSISDIIGIGHEVINGKSFYECIHPNCLPDAIRVIEAAKANDSIAYLKFLFRDPRHPEEINDQSPSSSDTDDGGGVAIRGQSMPGAYPRSDGADVEMRNGSPDDPPGLLSANSRTSSEMSDKVGSTASMFDASQYQQSRSSSSSVPPLNGQRPRGPRSSRRSPRASNNQGLMLEAVISCSSDGLVVILRRAENSVPEQNMQDMPQQDFRANQSLFAAPWGAQPIVPGYQPEHGFAFDEQHLPHVQALEAHAAATNGPVQPAFMNAIREVAVFAWALTGINGNISNYARGTPQAPAVPPQGFPVWNRNATNSSVDPPYNQAMHKWAELHARNTGAPAPSLPFAEREIDPRQYERQNNLVRNQYQHFEGPDAPGSYARQHLRGFIGEDGRGSGISKMGNRWTAGEAQAQQHPEVYRQQEQQVYCHLDQQQQQQQQGFGQGSNYGYQGPPIKQEHTNYPAGSFNGMGQQQAAPQFGVNRTNGNGYPHNNGNGNGNGFGAGYVYGHGINFQGSNYAASNGNRSNPQGSGGNSMVANGSGSGSGSGSGDARHSSAGTSPERYLWF